MTSRSDNLSQPLGDALDGAGAVLRGSTAESFHHPVSKSSLSLTDDLAGDCLAGQLSLRHMKDIFDRVQVRRARGDPHTRRPHCRESTPSSDAVLTGIVILQHAVRWLRSQCQGGRQLTADQTGVEFPVKEKEMAILAPLYPCHGRPLVRLEEEVRGTFYYTVLKEG